MKEIKNLYGIKLITDDKEPVVIDSKHLSVIIGQNEVKNKLEFFINSHTQQTPFPTMLFSGSQGLGKSYTAEAISKSLDTELITVNCGTCLTSEDFINSVLFGKVAGSQHKTIFFDEAHKLTSELTTILLTLLNPNKSNINYLGYQNVKVEYDMTKINVIFATTDAYMVFKPLLNRCEMIYFRLYNETELFDILESYVGDIDITCDKEEIAQACRGRARDAFILSQNIRRYSIMNKTPCFDNNAWTVFKNIFGIHKMGLRSEEIKLLQVVKDNSPISCANLAAIVGVNEDNIHSELEIRLQELGFIKNGARGRFITEPGIRYLENKVV